MSINITPEIEAAYTRYLDEHVDSDFRGTPILRRHTSPYSSSEFAGLVDFAAGYQGYAAALASQPNTPPGFVLVPAALLQEIDYAKHHGWPSESCARLELFASALAAAPISST